MAVREVENRENNRKEKMRLRYLTEGKCQMRMQIFQRNLSFAVLLAENAEHVAPRTEPKTRGMSPRAPDQERGACRPAHRTENAGHVAPRTEPPRTGPMRIIL